MIDFKNSNLGFDPIDPSNVFELAPRLKKVFKFENCEVFFKEVQNKTLSVRDGQSLFQGSLILPDKSSCLDFELVTNYLSSTSDIAIAPRDEKDEPHFGLGRIEFKTFKDLNTDRLIDRFLNEIDDAPQQLSFTTLPSLDAANKEIAITVNKLNKIIDIEQSMRIRRGDAPSDEYMHKISPTRLNE